MSSLDILIFILFSFGILIAGMLFTKRGRNIKSFFAAGGIVPWPISGLSLFMGFFSAGTFVVWGSIAYTLGWVAVSIQWTMAVAGFFVGLLIAPRWHKTGALTVAEYITDRLGGRIQKIYTYLFLFLSIFSMGAFLYPVARILEVSTGFSLNACIFFLGGLCIIYVAAGGLWAVIVTDVLKFVILTASVIIVISLSLNRINGVTAFVQSTPDHFFHLISGEYSFGFIISFGIYNLISLGGNWAYVQRYNNVRSDKEAGRVGYLFGILYLISPVLWMLPPMFYRVVNPGLKGLGNEGAYLLMCKEVLPSGILGMMLGGLVFTTASAINSRLNISSGVFTNDIFKRLYPNSTDRILMRVARFSTIGFGIMTIAVAFFVPYMGGIVNVVISLAALTGVPLFLPVIWCLFSKRQTGSSVITATILSLAVNVFFKFVAPLLFGFSLNRTEEMVLGVFFPVVCLLISDFYYKLNAKIPECYILYTQKMENKKVPVVEEKSPFSPDNLFVIKVIEIGIMITGLIVSILGINSGKDVTVVVAVGICLILLGFLIRRSVYNV